MVRGFQAKSGCKGEIMMRFLQFSDAGFEEAFRTISERGETTPAGILQTVEEILADVRERGDAALCEYTERFDRLKIDATTLEVSGAEIEQALAVVDQGTLATLQLAADRIATFHRRQKEETWMTDDEPDIRLGQMVIPLDRVGIYVPGGKAAYPSSVLMNAVPAKVAGVGEIIMVVPMPDGVVNPYVLAAAHIAGVDRIFKIGGAQAVAALAYGTASIPKVDKITGPGNIYVATAKRLVFGTVDIDMIAGPSEILVINDGSGEAAHIAADLLSQAEHDELAASILITTDEAFGRRVADELENQLASLSRAAIARQSIENYGAIIVARDLFEAAEFSNRIAPEHLELAVAEPFELLPQIRHAGAVFLGHNTPEAAGDYLAGPNHTLPTGGTARFFSPLGTDDFVKKSSLICFSKEGLDRLGKSIVEIAELEGLEAHAKSVAIRLDN
jgi:histidinol dehydrogenase